MIAAEQLGLHIREDVTRPMLVVVDGELDDAVRHDRGEIQRPVPEGVRDGAKGEIVRPGKSGRDRPELLKAVDDCPVREHDGRGG